MLLAAASQHKSSLTVQSIDQNYLWIYTYR